MKGPTCSDAPQDKGEKRHRTANLDADRLAKIVKLIARLPGQPTWADVVEGVAEQLALPYTRQALSGHPAIKRAFQARKNGTPARLAAKPLSARAKAQKEQVRRLRSQLAAAKVVEERLLERQLVWLYNAHAHGMTEADLNRPLPPVNRT